MKWAREDLRFREPGDFVRLDSLCGEVLREFDGWLQEREGLGPEEAGRLARAADRYLRDFLVDIQERGPAEAGPASVREYLGNWYVVNTLAPTHGEVEVILRSLRCLHRFFDEVGIMDTGARQEAEGALSDADFFHRRLEEFWELTPDEIIVWRAVDDYRRPRRRSR